MMTNTYIERDLWNNSFNLFKYINLCIHTHIPWQFIFKQKIEKSIKGAFKSGRFIIINTVAMMLHILHQLIRKLVFAFEENAAIKMKIKWNIFIISKIEWECKVKSIYTVKFTLTASRF